MRGTRVLLYLALPMCACLSALADRVTLKNGQTLEGLIGRETPGSIVLEIGAGSVTLDRGSIASIERSGGEEAAQIRQDWKRKYFLHRENVPDGLEDVASRFRAVSAMRYDAIRAQKRIDELDAAEQSIVAKIEALRTQLIEVGRPLESAPRDKDPEQYNAHVTEFNALQVKLTAANADLEQNRSMRSSTLSALSTYLEALQAFRELFAQRAAAYTREAPDAVKTYFFDTIAARLEGFDREFTETSVIAGLSGGNAFVPVTVNGAVRARFLLDTGASMVTIYGDLANRLNLDTSSGQPEDVTMADGRSVSASRVTLRSLQAGSAKIESVPAVVLPQPAHAGIDGLLGMSFLRYFVMRLDGANGKLVLKRFEPASVNDAE